MLDADLARAADPTWLADRAAAVARQAERVARESADAGEQLGSTRGRPQPVVCLDAFGYDGRPFRFPTSTAAGRALRAIGDGQLHTADHVRRAVVRGGTCGGRRFRWADGREVTADDRRRELDASG